MKPQQLDCWGVIHQLRTFLLSTPKEVAGVGFYLRLSVCLFVFPHDISKIDSARITQTWQNVPRWVLENPCILGRKDQRSRSRVKKRHQRESLHSCECWLFLVFENLTGHFCHGWEIHASELRSHERPHRLLKMFKCPTRKFWWSWWRSRISVA